MFSAFCIIFPRCVYVFLFVCDLFLCYSSCVSRCFLSLLCFSGFFLGISSILSLLVFLYFWRLLFSASLYTVAFPILGSSHARPPPRPPRAEVDSHRFCTECWAECPRRAGRAVAARVTPALESQVATRAAVRQVLGLFLGCRDMFLLN